jgi:dinuclear metal center YbgI/SA1388 family protein
MNISDLIAELENLAPPSLQESYDNSGLLVGDKNQEISSVLISLDCTEEVIEEAMSRSCNVVIAHHPILFGGLKSLTGKNYVERTILKAIRNNVAIYAIHTNLDNVHRGVNKKIAEKLGLKNLRVLSPKRGLLKKLVFFCPQANVEEVRQSVYGAGAGTIGVYDSCSFNVEGYGTFRGGASSNPYVGRKGEVHVEAETRVEVILPAFRQGAVLSALLKAHPYEEVAYDLYSIENTWASVGSGMLGELEEAVSSEVFLESLKENLRAACVRHTRLLKKEVKRIAVCGGSGSFLLKEAIAQQADVFVSADFKYHQFFDAEDKIVIADVGHYESEQFTPELIKEYLQEKIPNFAAYLSKVNTNPINYR